MHKLSFVLALLLPVTACCQLPLIASQRYAWKVPSKEIAPNIFAITLFEGRAAAMEYLQMSANTIKPFSSKTSFEVPQEEEHLLVIKDGALTIHIGDSAWSIGGGSIVLLMPGEKYAIQNVNEDSCHYYVMKYRSKSPIDNARGIASGGSIVKDWNKIGFKPHDRGGIRKYFDRATAMSKRFEMHVTTLKEGIKSHEPHTHNAEEIVLIIDNKTEMQIGDKFYKGSAGDMYYLGSNIPHAVRNDGKGTCTYFAFQFE